MPNSRSAKKSLRKSLKRRTINRSQRSTLRTTVKRVRLAADAGDAEGAESALRIATKKLDQAAAKHLIHKNAAARTKSRLARLVNAAGSEAGGEAGGEAVSEAVSEVGGEVGGEVGTGTAEE